MKAASKRWPVHIFYNVIDMALINSWVMYKAVCKSNIRHRAYIQKVCKELTGSLNGATESLTFEKPTRPSKACSATGKLKKKCDSLGQHAPKDRRMCSGKSCRNKTTDVCVVYQSPICGTCCSKRCLSVCDKTLKACSLC